MYVLCFRLLLEEQEEESDVWPARRCTALFSLCFVQNVWGTLESETDSDDDPDFTGGVVRLGDTPAAMVNGSTIYLSDNE